MSRRKAIAGAAIVAAALGLIGCKKTFESEVKKILKDDYKLTEEQALVAVVGANRWRFMVEKDGKYEFNYQAISLDDQLGKLKDMRDTVNEFLDPKNEQERRYVEMFGARPKLEHQERILNYSIDRFELVKTYAKFEQLMGRRHMAMDNDSPQSMPAPAGLSDLDILFPGTDLEKLLPFTAKYVEDAKAAKRLTQVESFDFSIKYQEEEPNPNYPHADPNHAKRWVERKRSLRIVSYDCDESQDHKADYIEAFRVNADGSVESKPALKAFKSQSSESLDVLVIDKDPESRRGHGIPDDVISVPGIKTGSELYKLTDLVKSLFEVPQQEKRQLPKELPMRTEIVRVGEVDSSEYEISPSGWTVPLDYKDEMRDNYVLVVKFADEKKDEPKDHAHRGPKARKIEYVAKRYKVRGTEDDVQGRVVEFYRVRPEVAENIRLVTIDDSTHMLNLVFDKTPASQGADSIFLRANDKGEIVPYRIDYDMGNLRISVEDRDQKPDPLYEAKKEIAKPKEIELRNDAKR